MKYLILILFLFNPLFALKEDINKKITTTNSKLHNFNKNHSLLNKKMASNAKAILRQTDEVKKQNRYLKKLEALLKKKSKSYKTSKSKLSHLTKSQIKLQSKQKKIEDELISFIAQSITLSMIIREDYSVDSNSLIESEILKHMLFHSKDKAEKLNKVFYRNSKNINSLNNDKQVLNKSISKIESKRKNLLKVQKENKRALKKLKKDKNRYKIALKKLLTKQDTLKKTLAGLNIIRIDRVRKAEEEKARKLAFRSNKNVISNKNLLKVKQHGTSYKALKTKKYKGSKTISPLDSYTISKKYGTYIDPIYGIKIFNEAISMKPKYSNAKVKTVFNGKVIYADKTAVLNNIVIVEHKNGLHTIYANLSRIQKNIKKGVKIKKGYIIGRVDNELIFEVTQKSYHINPVRLFQ